MYTFFAFVQEINNTVQLKNRLNDEIMVRGRGVGEEGMGTPILLRMICLAIFFSLKEKDEMIWQTTHNVGRTFLKMFNGQTWIFR